MSLENIFLLFAFAFSLICCTLFYFIFKVEQLEKEIKFLKNLYKGAHS